MAKHKKTTRRRTSTPRRRRIGGVGTHGFTGDFMEVVGLVAGTVAGTIAQRQLTHVNPKLIAAGEIAVGFALKKHTGHHPFMNGVGWGVLSSGAIGLAHDFRVISGVEDFINGIDNQTTTGYIEEHQMHGITNERYVSGISNDYSMNGAVSYMG
jgi:hypothetical protein